TPAPAFRLFHLIHPICKFPTMIHRRFICLLLFALSLPTLAQTSVDLMLKPFSEKTPIEINATGAVLDSGHTDNAGADYQLSLFDLSARDRFAPEQRIDPRIGVAATYLNFDTDDRAIPGGLLDASVAVGF